MTKSESGAKPDASDSCADGILLISSDVAFAAQCTAAWRGGDIPAAFETSYGKGLNRLRRQQPRLLIVQTDAGRLAVSDVISRARASVSDLVCIVLGTAEAAEVAIDWMRAGAVDVLDPELPSADLVLRATTKWAASSPANQSALLLNVLDGVSEAVVMWRQDGRFIYCNDMFRTIHRGVPVAFGPGLEFAEFALAVEKHWPELSGNHPALDWQKAYHRGEPSEQMVISDTTAQGRWYRITKQVLTDGSVMALWTDITDRKESESSLKLSEQRFRDFATLSSDRHFETDRNLKVTYISQPVSACAPSLQEMVGTYFWNPKVRRLTEDVRRAMRAAFETRKPINDFRYRGWRNEGRESFIRLNAIPKYDGDGNFDGYRGTVIDETEIYFAKSTADENRQRLFDALDAVNQGASLWDDQDRFVLCNATYQNYFGDRQHLLTEGKTFEEFLSEYAAAGTFARTDDPKKKRKILKQRLAAHRAGPVREQRFVRGRWYEAQSYRLENGYTLWLRNDITEFKERESELRRYADLSALLHRTATAANEAATVEQAYKSVIDDVCTTFGFSVGHGFVVEPTAENRLISTGQWFIGDDPRLKPMRALLDEEIVSQPGSWPLKIAATGKARWMHRRDRQPVGKIGFAWQKTDLQTFVFSPVMSGTRAVGVMSFMSFDERLQDDQVLSALQQIGTQLGRVIERNQAENAARVSEDRFREFIGLAAPRYWELDEDLQFSFMSQGVDSKFPILPGLIGLRYWELTQLNLADEVRADLKRIFERREPIQNYRFSSEGEDGRPFHHRISATPRYDDNGQFAGYRGISHNDTNVIEAQQALNENQRRFLDALDTLNEPVALWDNDDRLIMCNGEFRRFLGDAGDRVTPGATFEDSLRAYTNSSSFPFGDSPEQKEAWIAERLAKRALGDTSYEFQLDGRWLVSRNRRLSDGSRLLRQTDITEFKEREEGLERWGNLTSLLHRTASIANEDKPVSEVLRATIEDVSKTLDFDFAHVYLVGEGDPDRLISSGVFATSDERQFADLCRKTQRSVYERGSGGPAIVFDNLAPSWQRLDTIRRGKRIAEAKEVGLQTIIHSPMLIGNKLAGQLEFCAVEWRQQDDEVLAAMAQIGTQLGRVIERSRANRAIQENENRFRDFAGLAADRYFEMDASYRYTFISDTVQAHQIEAEAFLGRRPWEVSGRYKFKSDREELKRRYLAKETVHEFRFESTDREGQTVYLRLSATPIVDDSGNFNGYRETLTNETSFVEAQRKVEEVQRQFHDAVENSPAGFILWDADDRFVVCNQAWRDMQPEDAADLLIPGIKFDDYIRTRAGLSNDLADPATRADYLAERLGHRSRKIFESSWEGRSYRIVRHPLETGETMTFAFDITDLKNREKELREAQENLLVAERLATLGQLTGTVAHELRNPLGTIQSSADVLRRRTTGLGLDVEEPLQRLSRNIERCDGIISELLNFTRKPEPRFERSDLDAWLTAQLQELDLPEPVEVRWRPGLDGAEVDFDPERWRQVMINLIDNAVQAVADDKHQGSRRISIQTRLVDGLVEIAIEDSGPGIPADLRSKIFEPLFSTKSFGVGLGLPTVTQIVDAHRGAIEVRDGTDGGARFAVTIPVCQEEALEVNGA